MQSQVSELSPVLVEVTVEVPWERIAKDLEESTRKLSKTARIRGFRPGKAPRHVIRKLFGKQIRGEVTATLVQEGLIEAIKEHSLPVVGRADFEPPPPIEEGVPLTFSAKFEVKPELKEIALDNLVVYREDEEVTEASVDEEIERLRAGQAQVQPPETPRPAQLGDALLVDTVVYVDGEAKAELGGPGQAFSLDDDLLPELRDGLVGALPGEERTLEVRFPESAAKPELQRKVGTFKVKVHEVRERILPPLDDEFAQDVSDCDTLEALRAQVRDRLTAAAAKRGKAGLREQVVDRLLAANEVPVPEAMVRERADELHYRYAVFQQLLGAHASLTEDALDKLQERAERSVKASLLFGALARQHDIRVGDEDIERRLEELAEESGKHIAKLRAEYQGERRQELEEELMQDKLYEFVLSKADIQEGPAPQPAQDEASDPSLAEGREEGQSK